MNIRVALLALLAGCAGTTGDVLIPHDMTPSADLVRQPPSVGIDAPAGGTTVMAGYHVAFAGHANDPVDGALMGASLVWQSSIEGMLGTGAMLSTPLFHVGTHTITLTATDSAGLSASAQIHLIAQ